MGTQNGTGNQRYYVSYLLRMWRDGGNEGDRPPDEMLWRASLQSPHTSALVGFACLDDLFDFLRGQVGLQPVAKNVQNEV